MEKRLEAYLLRERGTVMWPCAKAMAGKSNPLHSPVNVFILVRCGWFRGVSVESGEEAA